jgi:predicted TPR repeat methyltransferase
MTQQSTLADLLASAVRQHEAGELAAAEALYRRVLERDPAHPDALHLLGLIAQAAGDFTSAAAGIRQALALRPNEAVFHYNLANVLHDAGQLEDAIASYRAALALRPQDADTLLNLGNALAAHGDPAAAADSYRTVLRHAPRHLESQVNLGQVLSALGDVDGARAAYQAVVKLDAGSVEAHLGLGALCQEAGDYGAAYGHYQTALKTNPDCAEIWNNLGTWHQECGERPAAADCYRRALTLDPQDAEAHNNLGTLLADENQAEEAEACYRAALSVRPEFAEAHKNRGAVLQALGRRNEALASFREAVRLRPDFAEAAYKLAALSGERPPATAPVEYVAALFDGYAGYYDQHMTSTLQYRVPQALCALLVERVPVGGEESTPALTVGGWDVLDLGCGTGLSGVSLRGLARQLTGIDLSPRMLARARERGLYDRLVEGDIVQVLAGQNESFDLVVAADVFVYIGDLEAAVASVAQVLRAAGWLAFSVESLSEGEYQLQPTGRYAHTSAYIEALARRHGFKCVTGQEVTLRVEQGRPVVGQLQLWQRTAV